VGGAEVKAGKRSGLLAKLIFRRYQRAEVLNRASGQKKREERREAKRRNPRQTNYLLKADRGERSSPDLFRLGVRGGKSGRKGSANRGGSLKVSKFTKITKPREKSIKKEENKLNSPGR